MTLDVPLSDEAILEEIGHRLARRRLAANWTQGALADRAGVSKRTVERVEAGESAQLSSWIRILRVLGLVEGLDLLVPEVGPSPMELLKRRGKERRRARGKRVLYLPTERPAPRLRDESTWTWGDDETENQTER
jgi:transcriptional regulator with XRE-family HTH domain